MALPSIQLHDRYLRREIASALGANLSPYWQQGVVRVGNVYLMFVTLEKHRQPTNYRYDDRFLSAETFQWQSQYQESRAKRGRKYSQGDSLGLSYHLFVRRSARADSGELSAFVYVGRVHFQDWDGDNPINIRWRLETPVPAGFYQEFSVP